MASGDYGLAASLAQRAWRLRPQDPAAVRVKIEIAERFHDPSLLALKSRLVELEPNLLANRVSLAETALRFDKPALAKSTLESVREAGSNLATYHALSGQAARALQESAKAQEEFAAALKLDPTNIQFRFDLAAEQLNGADPEAQAQARSVLEDLQKDPDFFRNAAHVLIRDSLRRKQVDGALALAAEMQRSPSATFEDKVVYLDLLHQARSPAYAGFLTELQEAATSSPEDIFALVSWLDAHDGAMLTASWLKGLSQEVKSTFPVRIAMAESYAFMRDWSNLEPLITLSKDEEKGSSKWGDHEFRRLAYSAGILQAKGDRAHSLTTWELATKAAGYRPEAHLTLARYAVALGWGDLTEALWRVAQGPIEQYWALNLLYREYERTQSSRGMYRVTARSYELNPSDPVLKNNFAFFGVLLGINVSEAVKLAREVHEQDPENADYTASYAFGLYVQGSSQEAIEVMKKLPAEKLELPQIATYLGVMLASEGTWEEAARYLKLGAGAKLLPEEKHLVDRAEAQVRYLAGRQSPQPTE